MLGIALLVVCAVAGRARASTNARLEWLSAPPIGCLDLPAIEATVESRLGRRVFVATPDAVSIQARFTHSEAGETVHLEILSPSGRQLGERQLSASDCEQLGSSLAVVIAVLLDLDLNEASQGEAGAVAKPRAAPAAVPPPSAAETSDARRATFTLAALAELALGLQPELAAGVELQGSWLFFGALGIGVWADIWLPSSSSGTPSITVQSESLGAGVCLAGGLTAKLRLGTCAGGGVTFWRASGTGFRRMSADERRVAELRWQGHLDYRLVASLFARLALGVSVPGQRPGYGYTDESAVQRELFRPSALAALGGLGILLLWP